MKLTRTKLTKIAAAFTLAAFAAILIAFPNRYLSVCFDGLCLWAECVLPSLFPFMVITLLLIKMGAAQAAAKPFTKLLNVFKLPAAAAPLFVMSVFSGYPAGSRILSEYCDLGLIDQKQAKKLAPLCSTCGPLFALGTVGVKAFGGNGAGVKLFCACIISVTLSSLIYSLFTKRAATGIAIKSAAKQTDALYSAFYGAVNASLVAGGFICFFYTLSKVIADFYIFMPLIYALSPLFGGELASGLSAGLCEATGGCFALAATGGFFALPLAGFLITFGGASILFQQLCYLGKCKVKAGFFVLFKFIQGVICFALLCLFSLW